METSFTITPGIERRLGDWIKLAQAQADKQISKPCVTISREYGCQAYPAAEALVNRFNNNPGRKGEPWVVLDRKLLEKIAEESGLSHADLNYAVKSHPLFDSLASLFMGKHTVEPYEVFTYIRRAVRHFATVGNSIIIGRGGACLTNDMKNCLHVRLIAPMEFRVEKVSKVFKIDTEEAYRKIRDQQQIRDDFTYHFTKMNPVDPQHYHLLINNAQYNPEEIAEIIEYCLGKLKY